MLRHLFLTITLSFLSATAFSQSVRTPITAAYTGFGAYSNNHIDVFSFSANQASLAKMSSAAAGVYDEKRFLLKELSFYNAVVALPTQSGNFAFDARYFGYIDNNEMQAGLAYARSLGKIDVGVQFNYYNLSIAGYGKTGAVNFEASTIFHLNDKLNAGFHLYNPVGGKLGKNEEEKLASIYSGGFGYNASEKFFVSMEIEKQEDQPVNVKAGMQYKFLPQLLTRVGINSASSSMFIGAGFSFSNFRFDATASYHPQLGISPGILLQYNFKKKA